MNGAALSSCYGRIVIAPPTLGHLVTWIWKIIFMSSIILGLIVEYRGSPGYINAIVSILTQSYTDSCVCSIVYEEKTSSEGAGLTLKEREHMAWLFDKHGQRYQ